jgi:hypothetical protein
MGLGFRNNLAKQMAEHLVCAELRRRDLLVTPFPGNVPNYDVDPWPKDFTGSRSCQEPRVHIFSVQLVE